MRGDSAINEIRFIVDHNVGKLTRWLRMMGYDSLFFNGDNDSDMVRQALAEGRVILTRDTEIMKRRTINRGQLKAIMIESDEPERQMRQIMNTLDLQSHLRPFTLCLECNKPLIEKSREEVKDRVPSYVYKTQSQYMECPDCGRIYWRGTHWKAMTRKLEQIVENSDSSPD